MKVSRNWVQQFVDIADVPLDELTKRIGEQLGGVDAVIDVGARYKSVVIARVVSVQDHPNADRLHVCLVDDGGVVKDVARNDEGLVQVVCGAPNVREGLVVAWLPPGSTVPETYDKDPFVLEARELRGEISNGMLASSRELALSDEHDGIIEIDVDAEPGSSFAEAYELNDFVIDIENKMFTHRPDCFGQLGVAREIAGILGRRFVSPRWYSKTEEIPTVGAPLPLVVENEVPELVPHLVVSAMADVSVKPSPLKIQTYLSRLGVRPINNVVDITNYVMLLTGQPLHAYDYDKVKMHGGGEAALIARLPRKKETLKLLNGKEIAPRSDAVVIASNTAPMGLGGVMGGSETEVDIRTRSIILEVATFDMYSIRRTSMEHGLFTDAVTRFNKGQSPAQNDVVAYYAMSLLAELSGAQLAHEVVDTAPDKNIDYWPAITLTPAFINMRLGLTLTAEDIRTLLDNVEFDVQLKEDGEDTLLVIRPPFWRTDIAIAEDIVEEVGRLYGYDRLPRDVPRRDIVPAQKDAMLELKARIRRSLKRAGANEALTYSFVDGKLIEKVGQSKDSAFQLSNALSPDLHYYRITVLPSLLDKVHANVRAGYGEFALFELGKNHMTSHIDEKTGLPVEFDELALVYSASPKQRPAGAPYYQARQFLTALARDFGLELTFKPIGDLPELPITKPYDVRRSSLVSVAGTDMFLGIVGEFTASVRKNLKLPDYAAGFEISLKELLEATTQRTGYTPLSRFPKVEQDISLRTPAEVTYAQVFEAVSDALEKAAPKHTAFSLQPIDIYQREADTAHRNITLRVSIVSYERTLLEKEVSKLLDSAEDAAKNLQAVRL